MTHDQYLSLIWTAATSANCIREGHLALKSLLLAVNSRAFRCLFFLKFYKRKYMEHFSLPLESRAGLLLSVWKLIAEQRILMVCVVFRMTRDKSYNALVMIDTTARYRSVLSRLSIGPTTRLCIFIVLTLVWRPIFGKEIFFWIFTVSTCSPCVDTAKTDFFLISHRRWPKTSARPAVSVHRYAYSFEWRHRECRGAYSIR